MKRLLPAIATGLLTIGALAAFPITAQADGHHHGHHGHWDHRGYYHPHRYWHEYYAPYRSYYYAPAYDYYSYPVYPAYPYDRVYPGFGLGYMGPRFSLWLGP
jgi:hypothetical protein